MKLIGRTAPWSMPAVAPAPVARSAPQAAVAVPELPYIVRRGRAIVAAFASKSEAGNWARDYSSFRDMQNIFYVHTAAEILSAYRDGSEVEVP